MKEEYDNEEGYCRMLGHFLTFSYCRSMNKGFPCGRVLDCWFQTFAVQQFINDHYSAEEQKIIFTPAKSKVLTLAEILEQAQQRLQQDK